MSMRHYRVYATTVALSAAVGSAGYAQCRYEVTEIKGITCPLIGLMQISVSGMNESGHLVGWIQTCNFERLAYVWTSDDGITILPQPIGYSVTGEGVDIDNHGRIAGIVPREAGSTSSEAAVWIDGTLEMLGTGSGDHSRALAINDDGVVAGWFNDHDIGPRTAFVWSGGKMTPLRLSIGPYAAAHGINRDGQVTGWMGSGPHSQAFTRHAFKWHRGSAIDLGPIPGGFSSEGRGINDDGDVVGYGRFNDPKTGRNVTAGFVLINGMMQLIEPLPGQLETTSLDINALGQVVGFSHTPDPSSSTESTTAFMWQHGVRHDLNDLTEFGAHFASARAINDGGQIAVKILSPASVALLTPVGRPPGDVDVDCRTDASDLQFVLRRWGELNSPADADQSGEVNVDDVLVVLLNWTTDEG